MAYINYSTVICPNCGKHVKLDSGYSEYEQAYFGSSIPCECGLILKWDGYCYHCTVVNEDLIRSLKPHFEVNSDMLLKACIKEEDIQKLIDYMKSVDKLITSIINKSNVSWEIKEAED